MTYKTIVFQLPFLHFLVALSGRAASTAWKRSAVSAAKTKVIPTFLDQGDGEERPDVLANVKRKRREHKKRIP